MTKVKHITLIFFVLLAISCNNSERSLPQKVENYTSEKGEIMVLFGYQAPPNAYYDENGIYKGLLVDFKNEIEKHLEYKFSFKYCTNWSELIHYSQSNTNFVIVGIASTEYRETFLKFTKPFVKTPYVIVTNKSSKIKTMNDLSGKLVCTVKDYAIVDNLKKNYPKIIIKSCEDNLKGLHEVLTGNCDAMIVNQLYASYLIEKHGIANLKIVGESGYLNELCAATSINDKELISIISEAVEKIPEKRQLTIYRKWVYAISPGISTETKQRVILVGLVTLLGFLILWLWVISLRKQVKKQTVKIKEGEAKYSKIIEKSYDLIYEIQDGKLLGVNTSFENMFGYSIEELMSKSFNMMNLFADESTTFAQKRLKELKNNSISLLPQNFEIVGKTKNGEKLYLQINETKISQNGKITFLGIVRDITPLKSKEIELIAARNKAEESDRLKSAFLANMSHEIRTPMNGILGFADLLKSKNLTLQKQSQYIAIIEESGNRMLTTINNLINISKIESGEIEINKAKFNINNELHYLYRFFRPETEKKNIRLYLSELIPEHKSEIVSDQEKFISIVTNLIKNAIKYTDSGEIKIQCSLQNHYLLFAIKDTGIGISDEMLPKIFDRFTQAEVEATKASEGSGLGLTISKAYVEKLGGKIWVESKLNLGSQFYFTIPIN